MMKKLDKKVKDKSEREYENQDKEAHELLILNNSK